MRRPAALLAAAALALSLAATDPAHAGRGMDECRFQRLDAARWTVRETRRTIGCFAERMDVDVDTALAISYRESRWHHDAYNRTGCGGYGCLGAFQMHGAYIDGWVRNAKVALRRYEVRSRWWANPRLNTVVALVKVRREGWTAWGG